MVHEPTFMAYELRLFPDLLFLAFLEKSKENHQKGKDFYCLQNPQNPWERREKTLKNRKEVLEKEKGKENHTKARKRRLGLWPTNPAFHAIWAAVLLGVP